MYLWCVHSATPVERGSALEAVFKPVQPPTTFEETVERLGTAIRLGVLAPGTRLPAERDLADQLNISRSTLRQALTTLVQSGHLVSQRGRAGGTFVADAPPLGQKREGVGWGRKPARCSTTAWQSRRVRPCWRPSARPMTTSRTSTS